MGHETRERISEAFLMLMLGNAPQLAVPDPLGCGVIHFAQVGE
jgi:hypothetical protein